MKNLCASLILALIAATPDALAEITTRADETNPAWLQSLEGRAANGNEKAQLKLAIMYLHGEGVTADTDKAMHYYRMAAERDIAFAQHRLARLYLDGDYVKADPQKALDWLLRSANLGYLQAQLDLSQFYENDSGSFHDLVDAYKWLSIASTLSDGDLQDRRERLEAKMTFIELGRAKLLSRYCVLTGYRDC